MRLLLYQDPSDGKSPAQPSTIKERKSLSRCGKTARKPQPVSRQTASLMHLLLQTALLRKVLLAKALTSPLKMRP